MNNRPQTPSFVTKTEAGTTIAMGGVVQNERHAFEAEQMQDLTEMNLPMITLDGSQGEGGGQILFTGFGAPRVRSEQVAAEAAGQAEIFRASGAAVDEHLADQLLLPLALARGGSFVTTAPSGHTRTNFAIIQEFLQTHIALNPAVPGPWRVDVEGKKTT